MCVGGVPSGQSLQDDLTFGKTSPTYWAEIALAAAMEDESAAIEEWEAEQGMLDEAGWH